MLKAIPLMCARPAKSARQDYVQNLGLCQRFATNDADEAAANDNPLAAGLGMDISGTPVMLNLNELPHVLIAGARWSMVRWWLGMDRTSMLVAWLNGMLVVRWCRLLALRCTGWLSLWPLTRLLINVKAVTLVTRSQTTNV